MTRYRDGSVRLRVPRKANKGAESSIVSYHSLILPHTETVSEIFTSSK